MNRSVSGGIEACLAVRRIWPFRLTSAWQPRYLKVCRIQKPLQRRPASPPGLDVVPAEVQVVGQPIEPSDLRDPRALARFPARQLALELEERVRERAFFAHDVAGDHLGQAG